MLVPIGMMYLKHLITLNTSSSYHKHNVWEDWHLPSHCIYDLGKQIYPGCLDTSRTARLWHLELQHFRKQQKKPPLTGGTLRTIDSQEATNNSNL